MAGRSDSSRALLRRDRQTDRQEERQTEWSRHVHEKTDVVTLATVDWKEAMRVVACWWWW